MTMFIAKFTRMVKKNKSFSTLIKPLLQLFSFKIFMHLTESIFPFWCVCALPIYSTKIDILVGDNTIMASAIIINLIDIQIIHTNNIAIMLIIHANHFIKFFFYQLSTIFEPSFSRKIL